MRNTERGAVVIHVAFGLLVLIAFSSFAVDFGMLWAARRQAQNAADAGAMAGAAALAFDDFNDRTDTGPAKLSAFRLTQEHDVWLQPPQVNLATDITFPDSPADWCDTTGLSPCVRVDVYRNQARGNPLQTIFASMVGVDDQGVRATATAVAAPANSSDCMKPIAVADKWIENNPEPGDWTPEDEFNRYAKDGTLLPNPDVYMRPTESDPGTGFTIAADYGTEFTLKPGNPNQAISPGWYLALTLPNPDGSPSTGGRPYRDKWANCYDTTLKIGDWVLNEPGNMIGPTRQGVQELIDKDPYAYWDPAANGGKGGVAGGCMGAGTCGYSPRMVALPVFDTDVFASGRTSGRIDIYIVNILGYFVDRLEGNDVIGYLTHIPGLLVAGGEEVSNDAAFLRTVLLIR